MEKAETDEQMGEEMGGRGRAGGVLQVREWTEWLMLILMSARCHHGAALAPRLPHESSSNPPFSSCTEPPAPPTPPPNNTTTTLPLKKLYRNRCVETACDSNDGKMGFTVPVALGVTPQHRVPLAANEDELLTRGAAAPSSPQGDKNDLI